MKLKGLFSCLMLVVSVAFFNQMAIAQIDRDEVVNALAEDGKAFYEKGQNYLDKGDLVSAYEYFARASFVFPNDTVIKQKLRNLKIEIESAMQKGMLYTSQEQDNSTMQKSMEEVEELRNALIEAREKWRNYYTEKAKKQNAQFKEKLDWLEDKHKIEMEQKDMEFNEKLEEQEQAFKTQLERYKTNMQGIIMGLKRDIADKDKLLDEKDEKIKELLKNYSDLEKTLKTKFSGTISDQRKKLNELEKENTALKTELQQKKARINSLERTKQKYIELQKSFQDYKDDMEQEIDNIKDDEKAKRDQMNAQFKKDISGYIEKISKKDIEINVLKKDKEKLEEEVASMSEEIRSLKADVKDLKIENSQLKGKIDGLTKQLKEKASALSKAETEVSDLRGRVSVLENEKKNLILTYERRIQELIASQKEAFLQKETELKDKIKELEDSISDKEYRISDLSTLKDRITELTQKVNRLKDSLKKKSAEITQLKMQLESREREISRLKKSAGRKQSESRRKTKRKSAASYIVPSFTSEDKEESKRVVSNKTVSKGKKETEKTTLKDSVAIEPKPDEVKGSESGDSNAYFDKAMSCVDAQDYDCARKFLKKAIDADPNNTVAKYMLDSISLLNGDE